MSTLDGAAIMSDNMCFATFLMFDVVMKLKIYHRCGYCVSYLGTPPRRRTMEGLLCAWCAQYKDAICV
jgi:hypothetical protein